MSEDTAAILFRKLKEEKQRLLAEGILRKQQSTIPITSDDSPPFDIPPNWCWVRLGDVSLIQEGPGIRTHQYCDEGIQFLTVTNILEGRVDLANSVKHISFEEFQAKYSHFQINKRDIVVACSGGSWGKSAIFEEEKTVILNTSTLRLRFFGDLGEYRYLYYLTKTSFFKNQIASHSTGQQPNFGYSHYSIAQIPLPPLSEQRRIVGILDEAFEGLATAKANAEQNLQNARALFESHLQAVFTQRGEGWQEKRLDEIAVFSQGVQIGLEAQSTEPGPELVRFIRIIDYTQGTNDVRYVKDPGVRFWVEPSEIVMVRYGTPGLIGRGIEGVIANNLFKISPINAAVTNDFLAFFLGQRSVQDYLSSQGSSTMPALTFKQLGAVEVAFPPSAKEQNSIAAQLDSLHEETQRLESLYQRKLAALDELKKSLLHRAFSGQL